MVIFRNGQVERGNGKPGYDWHEAYSEKHENGAISNPMILSDWRAIAKPYTIHAKLPNGSDTDALATVHQEGNQNLFATAPAMAEALQFQGHANYDEHDNLLPGFCNCPLKDEGTFHVLRNGPRRP